MSEHEPHFEHDPNLEQAIARLAEFARELGLVSTSEMDSLVVSINKENEEAIIPQWHAIASAQVEQREPGADHMKAEAGLMLEQIRIHLKTGNTVYARRSLNDAIEFLDYNRWFDNDRMEDITDYLNDLGYLLQDMEK
jgi:hypothetical protein